MEIAGSDALVLNGSTIQRVSTFPSQAANLSLLSGGSGGGSSGGGSDTATSGQTSGLSDFSLRGGGNGDDDGSSSPVVIDCSEAPVVENVTATAFAGEYGAGQRIYFQVRYEREVHGVVSVAAHLGLYMYASCIYASCLFWSQFISERLRM